MLFHVVLEEESPLLSGWSEATNGSGTVEEKISNRNGIRNTATFYGKQREEKEAFSQFTPYAMHNFLPQILLQIYLPQRRHYYRYNLRYPAK